MEEKNIPDQLSYDRMSRLERRRQRRGGSVMGGLLLIALAVLLLMQNQGMISFGKWWALLILIPAVAAFINAGSEFSAAGNQVTRHVITLLVGGLILTAITAAILFNLDWGWIGPALMLLVGIVIATRSSMSVGEK